jgi:hypothetical protein
MNFIVCEYCLGSGTVPDGPIMKWCPECGGECYISKGDEMNTNEELQQRIEEIGKELASFLSLPEQAETARAVCLWPEHASFDLLEKAGIKDNLSGSALLVALGYARGILMQSFEVGSIPAAGSVDDWLNHAYDSDSYFQARDEGWENDAALSGYEAWGTLRGYVAEVQALTGLPIINVTPHVIVFQTADARVVSVPPSGILINAVPTEEVSGEKFGATLVTTKFVPEARTVELLKILNRNQWLPVGSIIAAQAYPGQVVAMVPAPGFERVPPAEKRMRVDKFTTF